MSIFTLESQLTEAIAEVTQIGSAMYGESAVGSRHSSRMPGNRKGKDHEKNRVQAALQAKQVCRYIIQDDTRRYQHVSHQADRKTSFTFRRSTSLRIIQNPQHHRSGIVNSNADTDSEIKANCALHKFGKAIYSRKRQSRQQTCAVKLCETNPFNQYQDASIRIVLVSRSRRCKNGARLTQLVELLAPVDFDVAPRTEAKESQTRTV